MLRFGILNNTYTPHLAGVPTPVYRVQRANRLEAVGHATTALDSRLGVEAFSELHGVRVGLALCGEDPLSAHLELPGEGCKRIWTFQPPLHSSETKEARRGGWFPI